jgi:type I restriction enzyme S subunit
MAADKQDKVLNFSSEREQSRACSSSAEREKNQGKNFLNVPTLRFPEFDGEWKKERLKDKCSFFSGGTPSSTNKTYYDGDIPFIRSGEIASDSTDLFLSESGLNNSSAKIVEKGDLLLALYGATSGQIAISQIKGAINQAILCIRSPYDKVFLKSAWEKRVEKILQAYLQGGQGNLSAEIVKNLSFYFPSLQEQRKIGQLILLIDERISTQNRVINKLKSLMQGLNNELMDNPKWDKVYVGDFMEFYSTNSLSWEQLNYDDGQVRNLHYGLIHSGLTTLVDCQKTHLPYIQEDSLPKQYSICKDGDVAFADASEDTAEVGKVIELTNIYDKKIVCGLHTIHGRDVKGMTVKGFKGFAFNSKYFHDQLRRIAQGSKVYSINTDNLKSCYLCIPTITEQKKMVGLLHCLQDKIGVAEQELFLYESQKRFLLNNLFV